MLENPGFVGKQPRTGEGWQVLDVAMHMYGFTRRHTQMVRQLNRDQELESQQAEAAGQQPAVREFRSRDGLPAYQLPGNGLSMGASLGNGHCWITTKGRG